MIRSRRRGVVLLMSLILISIVAALIAVIISSGSYLYRQRRTEHTRIIARAVTNSAVGMARSMQITQGSTARDLDVASLLPATMTGTARLSPEGTSWKVSVRVVSGPYEVADEVTVAPIASTQPSPSGN